MPRDSTSLPIVTARIRLKARLWPFALVLLLGAIWGATFSLAKIATEGGAHPLGLSLWQGIMGGLLLLSICLLRRRPPRLAPGYGRFYLVCALFGTAVPGTIYFYAAPHVPAGVLAITIATVPMMTYALTALLKVEGLSFARIVGLLLGLVAVALLVGPDASLPDRAMVPWVLAAVLAAGSYAGENMFIALKRPAGSDALAMVAGMLIMAALLLLPVVLVTGTFVPLAFPWGKIEWAIFAMMTCSAFAYVLFLYLVSETGPVFASQTAYSVTIAGVLWGMVIFDEQHSLWVWASLAVMLAGLALVNPKKAAPAAVS